MSVSSNVIQVPVSALIKAGVTVTNYDVEEILSILTCAEESNSPFFHLVHMADNQRIILPISELRELGKAIAHLPSNEQIFLIYREKSGYCVFQIPDGKGDVKVFTITNQRQLKHLAQAS